MHSWEVLCVGYDETSEYDDCRGINKIGLNVAENLREKKVDQVAYQLRNDQTNFHIVVDGREVPLNGIIDGMERYVRTFDEDRTDDPLLDLPTIEEYKQSERRSQIR